jgi:hypothetical protein
MRSAMFGATLLALAAAAPVEAAPSGNEVITAISLSDLADLLNASGLPAQIESIQGTPIVVANLAALGIEGYIHIGGMSCGSDLSAANTSTPCQVLEFVAVLEVAEGVSEAAVQAVDRKFELSSIERVDATHVAVSDGVVLMGGITAENLGANIGFFAGQCLAVGRELAKAAGRTS